MAPRSALSLSDLVRDVKVALLQVNEAAEKENLPALNNAVLQANTWMKMEFQTVRSIYGLSRLVVGKAVRLHRP